MSLFLSVEQRDSFLFFFSNYDEITSKEYIEAKGTVITLIIAQ